MGTWRHILRITHSPSSPGGVSSPGGIDLWAYAWDAETPVDELIYELHNTPSTGAGVMLADNRTVIADPSSTWCGGTDVTVRVTEG